MGKIQSWLWRRIGELQLKATAPAGWRRAAVIYQWWRLSEQTCVSHGAPGSGFPRSGGTRGSKAFSGALYSPLHEHHTCKEVIIHISCVQGLRDVLFFHYSSEIIKLEVYNVQSPNCTYRARYKMLCNGIKCATFSFYTDLKHVKTHVASLSVSLCRTCLFSGESNHFIL